MTDGPDPGISDSGHDARRGFGPLALLAAALLGATLAAGGVLLATGGLSPGGAGSGAASPGSGAVAPARQWQCPMHPTIVKDHPGDCPICGMKLVEVESVPPAGAPPAEPGGAQGPDAAGGAEATPPGLAEVRIDPVRQQLIGLRTAEVTRGPVGGEIRTSGRVVVDETRVRRVHVKSAAYVERVHVDFVGRPVRAGEPLLTVYSPDLLAAQEEYLLALRTRDALAGSEGPAAGDGEALVGAARRKLDLLDVPEAAVDRLTRTRSPERSLTLVSPVTGVVTRKEVVAGMRLEAGAMPYEVVDLSSVWVLADVYEREIPRVRPGLGATLRLYALPGRELHGKVAFVDPVLDPATRTAKVRLAFPSPRGDLRPEMAGEVVLAAPEREGLRIPADAVLDSGTEQVVFVSLGEGRFRPREVRLGEAAGDRVEVVDGLAAGERVVVRASFLVDSESRLRASLAELAGDGAAGAAAGPHAGHATPGAPAPQPSAPSDPSGHSGHGR